MRRLWFLVAAMAAAFVLASCTVTITPIDPFPGALPIDAVDNRNTPAESSSVAGNSNVVYDVTVSSGVVAGDDLLFFELSTEALAIVVYNSSGTAIASSASKNGFQAGAGAASIIAPAGITVSTVCGGSCVILPAASGNFFVKVVNNGSGSVNFDLFAFGDPEGDDGEPANDSTTTAPSLSISNAQQGAIETLGDQDYYSVTSNGQLSFTSSSTLALRAAVIDAGGSTIATLSPGQTAAVLVGDRVRVYEDGNNAAGPAGSSRYSLTF